MAAVTETERFGLREESGSGIELLVLAVVAVDRNELERAQTLLDTAADSHHAMRDPVMRAVRALATARLLLARGETHAALEAAEPGVVTDVVSPWSEAHKALVTSAAHLAEGRPETAAELLQEVPGDQPACVVGAARAQLAAGRPVEALDLLDRVRPEGRTGPAVTVRASLVRAQAADRAGDSATARRLVAHALHEARRERLRRPSSKPDRGSGPCWARCHCAGWPRACSPPDRHRATRSGLAPGTCRRHRSWRS